MKPSVRNRIGPGALPALLLFVTAVANAFEPQAEQILSSNSALLGERIDWTIRVTHPLWKSYTLTVHPCRGAEVRVVNEELTVLDQGVQTSFHLQIIPLELSIPDVPSVSLTDEKGKAMVLTGKAISVRSISGEALRIRDPEPPTFSPAPFPWWLLQSVALMATALLAAWLLIRWRLSRTPKARLIRQIESARSRFRKQKTVEAPVLIRLLRSEILWGKEGNSLTAVELLEKAKSDSRKAQMAQGILALEQFRYSGASVFTDRILADRSMQAAIDLLRFRGTR